jgi:catalase
MEAVQRQRDERLAQTVMLSFTADDGLLMAELAGEALAGRAGHALRPNLRPVHTRGVLMTGKFTTTGKAGPHAPAHLRGSQKLEVIARFSSCDASADADDRRMKPRGLAVRFFLPDGRSTDLLGMSVDRFPVTTRDGFVSASKALRSRPLVRYPRLLGLSVMRVFKGGWANATAFPPTSYAYCSFYALHTFVWTTGGRQYVRYQWRPADSVRRLWPWIGLRNKFFRPPGYLRQDLEERKKPVCLNLEVLYPRGVDDDRLRDIRKPLPDNTCREIVGTLCLYEVLTGDQATERDRYLFSPAHLIEGIDPFPGDEIMTARTAAYPASHVYRLGAS